MTLLKQMQPGSFKDGVTPSVSMGQETSRIDGGRKGTFPKKLIDHGVLKNSADGASHLETLINHDSWMHEPYRRNTFCFCAENCMNVVSQEKTERIDRKEWTRLEEKYTLQSAK